MLDLVLSGLYQLFSRLHHVGRITVFDFSVFDKALQPLGALVPDTPTLDILVCMLATYPLSILFRSLPSPAARHTFSLFTGLFVVQFCLRQYWIHSIVSTTLCYAFMLVLPGSWSPVLVSLTAVFWVSAVHIVRMGHLEEPIDYSGVQMILTIKLISLAFNLLDGHTLFATVAADTAAAAVADASLPALQAPEQKIIEERKARAVRQVPNPLEYFSYMFFFGGILTGPAFDYVEYSTSVDLSKYGSKGALIPSPVVPALKKLAFSLVFLGVFTLFEKDYPVAALSSPEFRDSGDFFSRLFYAWTLVFVQKCKFYFIWLLTEGGCILCSFGFEGYSEEGEARWGGLNNIDVFAVELGQSIREATTNWNKNTSLWLRRYVYERVPPPFHLFSTYVVSAAWHGFHPGYYGFFLSAAVGQETARAMRQKFRYRFLREDGTPKPTKVLYDLAGFLLTQTMVAYTACAFFILRLDNTIAFWGSLYYFGHLLIVLPWLALPFFRGAPKKSPKKEVKEVKEE